MQQKETDLNTVNLTDTIACQDMLRETNKEQFSGFLTQAHLLYLFRQNLSQLHLNWHSILSI